MGLADRKQKQRIPVDPRNLNWADDASRFGHSYLSKFGWDASQGLGSSGDGMKTHIKVQQKLDVMGIGAQHQRDPNGIAWKQNKDFEALLKRLNESTEQNKEAEDEEGVSEEEREAVMDMFVRAQDWEKGKKGNESSVTTKKRKREGRDNPDTSETTRKKKEKHKKSTSDDSASPPADRELPSALALSGSLSEPLPKPRPMAHRARIRAAKRIAGKPASAISEILGIAPSSSVSSSTSTAAPTPTPPSTSAPDQHSLSLDNLTTSTKSVADYFKEKILARSSTTSLPASPSSMPSESVTPGLGASRPRPESSIIPFLDDGEPPRRGIGCQPPIVIVEGQGQEMPTEKQRRKVERKAEKRKQREAEANQAISEGVSADAKKQMGGDGAERAERLSREDKKQKKRREREPQASADQPDENDSSKSHDHNALRNSLQESNKKFKKERKK